MNRPAVLRHIDSHVARRAVTAFRLRAADAERLMDYVEHLERHQAHLTVELVAADVRTVTGELCKGCGCVSGHMAECPAV